MKAYKLSILNDHGFEIESVYFKSLNQAKKQFNYALKQKLRSEDIAIDEEKIFWTYSNKDDVDLYYSKKVRKEVCVPFRRIYYTDCGLETDIVRIFIRLENITIL